MELESSTDPLSVYADLSHTLKSNKMPSSFKGPGNANLLLENDNTEERHTHTFLNHHHSLALRSSSSSIASSEATSPMFSPIALPGTSDLHQQALHPNIRLQRRNSDPMARMRPEMSPYARSGMERSSSEELRNCAGPSSEPPSDACLSKKQATSAIPSSNVRRHICPWEGCGKEFTESYNLKAHFFIHSNIRPYKCTQCEADFVRKRDLERHVLNLHRTGEKQFLCQYCGNSFGRKDSLRRHEKRCTATTAVQ